MTFSSAASTVQIHCFVRRHEKDCFRISKNLAGNRLCILSKVARRGGDVVDRAFDNGYTYIILLFFLKTHQTWEKTKKLNHGD